MLEFRLKKNCSSCGYEVAKSTLFWRWMQRYKTVSEPVGARKILTRRTKLKFPLVTGC